MRPCLWIFSVGLRTVAYSCLFFLPNTWAVMKSQNPPSNFINFPEQVGDGAPTRTLQEEARSKVSNTPHNLATQSTEDSHEGFNNILSNTPRPQVKNAQQVGSENTPENQNNALKPEIGNNTNAVPNNTNWAKDLDGDSWENQDCGQSPGADITVHLPQNRDEVGQIVFPGSDNVQCGAKGKGSQGGMDTQKGDTPLGEYKADYLGGNSSGSWGGPGVHMQQVEIEEGRSTSDLFIHSKAGLETLGQLEGRQSWGCVVVGQQCIDALRKFVEGKEGAAIKVIPSECKPKL